VKGDDQTDPADFKRHILVGEGGVYNPAMIGLTLQFLNQTGIYRPLTPADVEIKIDDAHAAVEIVFHVTRRQSPHSH
jgi:hypothetical protein